MTTHAHPDPSDAPSLGATTHELLVELQRRHHEVDRKLSKHLDYLREPAQLRGPFRLNATNPRQTDDVGQPHPSFGLINANPVTVYIGHGGAPARPGQAALSCPPNAIIVLPLALGDVELGIDPTDPMLAAGDVVVHVLRFHAVQATFLGAL